MLKNDIHTSAFWRSLSEHPIYWPSSNHQLVAPLRTMHYFAHIFRPSCLECRRMCSLTSCSHFYLLKVKRPRSRSTTWYAGTQRHSGKASSWETDKTSSILIPARVSIRQHIKRPHPTVHQSLLHDKTCVAEWEEVRAERAGEAERVTLSLFLPHSPYLFARSDQHFFGSTTGQLHAKQ